MSNLFLDKISLLCEVFWKESWETCLCNVQRVHSAKKVATFANQVRDLGKNTLGKASVGMFSFFQTENQQVRVGYMDRSASLRRNKELVLNLP